MPLKEQYLDERFTTSIADYPPLPFFHSCEALYLQSILDTGELRPRPCKLYKENLLYLFYGRPAYRSGELSNSRFNFMMPVCFIINYDAVTKIKRAVAFDSGAFDLYAPHLHEGMTREEFYITPTKETLHKMVHYFFDGNEPYFNGEAKKDLEYDPIHYQVEGYHSLLTSKYKTGVDDRKATIELQLDYAIPINNINIEAVIMPKHLAESVTIKTFMKNLNIPTIGVINYGLAARDYYVHILQTTRTYLIKKDLLHDN